MESTLEASASSAGVVIIVITVALVLLAITGALFVGCTRMVERDGQNTRACITAGGSWVGGNCVMPRDAPSAG